jgi:hypothetical protein
MIISGSIRPEITLEEIQSFIGTPIYNTDSLEVIGKIVDVKDHTWFGEVDQAAILKHTIDRYISFEILEGDTNE